MKEPTERSALQRLGDVPCNGCTLCCRGDTIRLLPEDDPGLYRTVPHLYVPGALMLAHKANAECVYLGSQGCTIHATKPMMCRQWDCRRAAQTVTWTQARKLQTKGLLRIAVWRRGKDLLRASISECDRDRSTVPCAERPAITGAVYLDGVS